MTPTTITHISNARELITSPAEVRAGFLSMALEKNRRAIPFVEEGRALRAVAMQANEPSDLLSLKTIQPALLTASGLSDKSLKHLAETDKTNAIAGLIEKFLEPAGDDFVNELVYRFLLIRGDTLGGSMRNIAGSLAEVNFKRSVISALSVRGIDFLWESKKSRKWLKADLLEDDVGDVKGIGWNLNGERTLVFNRTVRLISKNIDICLLRCSYTDIPSALGVPSNYVLLGELKGGIDPAGADEHWKTARTALERIIEGFDAINHSVETVFIGAAIEAAMAEEIWSWLKDGKLSNAGNLTDKNHIASVCSWLVEV